jgi:urease accessory protein
MNLSLNPSFYAKNTEQLARVGCWKGQLVLVLDVNSKGRTVLKHKRQNGPYTLQRPLYPEGDVCHLILLHPPGGLVEADTLGLSLTARANTHTVVTTPSAGKVYCCASEFAGQSQVFEIENDGYLEWFPQETILYEASKSQLDTVINLADGAKFAGWEILCLGRPISDDFFRTGHIRQHIKLSRNGKLIFQERFDYQADSDLGEQAFNSDWGLQTKRGIGTLTIAGASKQELVVVQEFIEHNFMHSETIRVGATLIEDILICRALSAQSRYIKDAFTSIWSEIRQNVMGKQMHYPRIWNT